MEGRWFEREYKKCFDCGHEEIVPKENAYCRNCLSNNLWPIEAEEYTSNEIMKDMMQCEDTQKE